MAEINPIVPPFIGTATVPNLQSCENPPDQYFVSLPFHLILPIVLRLANFKYGRMLIVICSLVILQSDGSFLQVTKFPEAENSQILVVWLAQAVAALLFSLVVFNAVNDATSWKTVTLLIACSLSVLRVYTQPEMNDCLFSTLTTDLSLVFYNVSVVGAESLRWAIQVNYCFDMIASRGTTRGSFQVTVFSAAIFIQNIYSTGDWSPFAVIDIVVQLACIVIFFIQPYLESIFITAARQKRQSVPSKQERLNLHAEQEWQNACEEPNYEDVHPEAGIMNGEDDKDFAQISVQEVNFNDAARFVSGQLPMPRMALTALTPVYYLTHSDMALYNQLNCRFYYHPAAIPFYSDANTADYSE